MSKPTGSARALAVAEGLRRGLRRGLRSTVEAAHRHRRILFAVSLRLAWWTAVVLLVVGGRPMLGMDPLPSRWVALVPFAVGLGLCAVLRLVTGPRHLRTAALGLGALHGTAVMLVWTAFEG
jgi:hypothetical protein